MYKLRIGKDFAITWPIYSKTGGEKVPYVIDAKNAELKVHSPFGDLVPTEVRFTDNLVRWIFRGRDQKQKGVYNLELVVNDGKDGMVTVDTCKAFALVGHSCEESVDAEGGVLIDAVTLDGSEVNLAPVQLPGESYDDTELREMIAAQDTKLTELSAETDNLKDGIIAPFGNVEEQVSLAQGTKVDNLYAALNNSKYVNSTYFDTWYIKVEKDTKFRYVNGSKTINDAAGISVTDAIPSVGVAYTPIARIYPNEEGVFEVRKGQYVVGCMTKGNEAYLPTLYARYRQSTNILSQLNSLDEFNQHRVAALSSTYFLGNRMIDTITRTRWHQSTNTKIGNFLPLSATDKTITLSADDAACIPRVVIMACEMADGSCEYAYFSAASGNTITMLYDFNESIDCRKIVKMQSIHDTTEKAYGQHLSPLGSKAFAKDIYRQLGEICQFSDIQYCGGWTAQYCQGAIDYTDTSVVDSYGKLVCQPILDGIKVGGYETCGMVFKASIAETINAWTNYRIKQTAPNGASITFPLKATHQFKGFLRVVCGREQSANGRVTMAVKHNDDIIASHEISQYLDRYIIPLDGKFYDGVSVVFTMPDATTTEIKIIEMTMHETYVIPAQYRTIDETSVVAVLGDSFTQFPSLAVAQNLMPSDAFNEIVTRPDGSQGDGCGYYPKELARLTGAVVDNWGKSGETTSWGLQQIQKVLSHKRYTHIVISLFANDLNQGVPQSTIISNLRIMAEYAKGCGCLPIILMGYPTESDSQSIKWNGIYDCLTQGFDSPFIYTSSAIHL